jgi:hypothetical protein
MSRPARITSVVVASMALVAYAAPVTALAGPASPDAAGSATSKAAYGSAATIGPSTPVGSGVLGSAIADLIQPIVDLLTQQVNSTVSGAVVGLLNSSGNTADTTTGPSSYPTGPLLNVGVPGILALTLNGPSGSVSASSSAYAATSTFTDPQLSVLGISLADLGVANASVNCPTGSGDPSATVSLSVVSLFGGLVKAKLASGSNLLQVSLNGGAYQSISGLSTTLANGGSTLSVRANGNFLQVSVTISLSTLLGSLGLGGLLGALGSAVDISGTALTLALDIGPGNTPPVAGATSATAWGLEVGADLSGTVSVSVLGLLGALGGSAVITIPSGISGTSAGNLLDLKLGYATCTKGTAAIPGSQWIPPGLI